MLGVARQVRSMPDHFADPPSFGVVADAAERVVAATLRTPPFNQVLSEVDDPAAIDLLAEDAAPASRLPGVSGPKEVVARFAGALVRANRAADPGRPLGAHLPPRPRRPAGAPGAGLVAAGRATRPRAHRRAG